MSRRAATRFLVGAWLALLAGCAGTLLPQPPAAPARFTLEGATAASAPRPPAADAPVLVVAVPRAPAGLDSPRLVYLRRPQELEAFGFHEWIAPPAQMLAPLIVRSLQDSGAFRAVLLAPSSGTGALRLETDLLRLQHDFTVQPSRVRLTLRAVLLDTATRQVIAWREFDESAPAASDDPVAGVAAAHQATQRLLAALAVFCAEEARR